MKIFLGVSFFSVALMATAANPEVKNEPCHALHISEKIFTKQRDDARRDGKHIEAMENERRLKAHRLKFGKECDDEKREISRRRNESK